MSYQVGDLSWDEVAQRLADGAFAVLPVGAGAKQHGWHLPMRADALQAEWLANRLAEARPALVWPTLAYGHYPAFVAYAGSCSLSAPTFETMVHELLAAFLDYRASAIVVIDTGISTILPIDQAIAKLASDRVLHVRAYDGPCYRSEAQRLATQSFGGHADELETSCLLALAPHLVRLGRSGGSPPTALAPGPLQHSDVSAPNYSASGAIGDPASATATKGKALLAAMVADMLACVADWESAARSGLGLERL